MNKSLNQTVKAIETECRLRGKTLTAPRKRVLCALIEADEPQKAYDIVETIGDVKPMTVYRALDFFTEEGFIHRIESLNAYILCAEDHCHNHDSQYIICTECNKVTELHDHSIDDHIRKRLEHEGFLISNKTLEIRGICRQCQN